MILCGGPRMGVFVYPRGGLFLWILLGNDLNGGCSFSSKSLLRPGFSRLMGAINCFILDFAALADRNIPGILIL